MSKTSTTLMKSDNYINPTTETRSTQTHTGTTRFLNLNAAFGLISLVCLSFSHVLRWRHIRFGEHFTQNQKLGFHRKVARFDFAGEKGFDFSGKRWKLFPREGSIWPCLVTKLSGDENH